MSLDADSIVKHRFNGESSVIELRSRIPRLRRYSSSMNVNSTGAGGHLYGIPAMPTWIRPPLNRASSSRNRCAPSSE